MEAIDWLRWAFVFFCGAVALRPDVALKILFGGQPPDDAEQLVRAVRLMGYAGLGVVIVSLILDDLLIS